MDPTGATHEDTVMQSSESGGPKPRVCTCRAWCSAIRCRMGSWLFSCTVLDLAKAITQNTTPWSALHRDVLNHAQRVRPIGDGKLLDCIVVASKVEEDRRVAQLVSNFCVSEDAAVRQGGLSTIKQWWETATKSVKDSLANADVTCFRRVVIWPSLRWVRETCLRLYKYKWQTPSPEVDKQVRAIAVMQPGAKSVEDTIGHCKGAAEQSSAMKLSAAATWHSASTGGIIEGLGWRQPRRTQVAQTCARSDGVSTTAFECNHKDFSLVTDVLCEFNTDRPHVVQRGFEQAQMDGTRLETGRREEW